MENRFKKVEDKKSNLYEVYLDIKTNLQWEIWGSDEWLTFTEATRYSEMINTKWWSFPRLWRLPTVAELVGVVGLPVFPENSDFFWSSVFSDCCLDSMAVNLTTGTLQSTHRKNTLSVRCVR
jgi:hypothetical protein